MYVCMYVIYVRNAAGMQVLQTYILWAQHCLRACTMMEFLQGGGGK